MEESLKMSIGKDRVSTTLTMNIEEWNSLRNHFKSLPEAGTTNKDRSQAIMKLLFDEVGLPTPADPSTLATVKGNAKTAKKRAEARAAKEAEKRKEGLEGITSNNVPTGTENRPSSLTTVIEEKHSAVDFLKEYLDDENETY